MTNDSRWVSLQNRIKDEAHKVLYNNQSDGVAIITIHVMVDGTGEPLFWVVPEGRRIEPSRDAKLAVHRLLDAIVGG